MQRLYITNPTTATESQYSGYLRPDRKFEIGVKASNGEADQGDLLLDDDTGSLDFLTIFGGHRKVRLTEDASGAEKTFFRGRIASRELDRGHYRAARGREFTLSLEDANADLAGIIVHNWVRPAETGRDRALALRTAFLNGSSSTALNPEGGRYARDSTVIAATYMQNAGNVTMPAETYDASSPLEVLRACAEFENKRLGVYINDDGTLALYYAPKAETAQLNCTLLVSDNPADVDRVTCFAPNWIAGPGLHLDTDEQITGALLIHADGTTYDRRETSEATHDRWEEAVYSSKPAASGTLELGTLLDARQLEQPRRQFAIRLPASKIHLVKAGMRIEVRRAVVSGVDSSTFFRIANVRYSWLSSDDSENQYNVIVTLETPVKMASTWTRPVPDNYRRAVGGATTGSITYEPLNSWRAFHQITIPVTDISWQNNLTAGAIYPTLHSQFYGADTLAGRFRDRYFMSWLVNAGTRATAGMGGTWYISPETYVGTFTWQLVSSYWGTGQPLTIEPEGHIVASGSFTNPTFGDQVAIGTFEVPITSGRVQLYLRTNFPDDSQVTKVYLYGLAASPNHINSNFVQLDTPAAYYGESYGPVPVAIADGSTSSWTLPYPVAYKAGTLNVEVDGIWQVVSEDDPATGLFSLGWTPGAGDQISATWRVPSV